MTYDDDDLRRILRETRNNSELRVNKSQSLTNDDRDRFKHQSLGDIEKGIGLIASDETIIQEGGGHDYT